MIVFLAWGVHPGAQAPERMGLGKDVLVSCRTRATLRDREITAHFYSIQACPNARPHERTSARARMPAHGSVSTAERNLA